MNYAPWTHEYVLASRERSLGRSSELLSAVRAGILVPVSRGVYRLASARTPDAQRRPDDDYLARVRAAQLRSADPIIVAGMSAAAVWDLPVVGSWPERVVVASARADGGRSNAHLTRSYVGFPPPTVERDGLTVTTLARTVVDVARVESMERAVAVADAALRGQEARGDRQPRAAVSAASLAHELELMSSAPGSARARGVIQFADGRSGSPGESCSRVGMHRLGLTPPTLQEVFVDARGTIGVVDFWWPHCGLVGEFDGQGKYRRDEFLRGRSAADVVVEEKRREDRLRALGLRVVRWEWADTLDLARLEAKLRGAGLR